MRTLRVLHALPRCGGTMISAHLSSTPGVALLSEIHPSYHHVGHPLDQARSWHSLVSAEEASAWRTKFSFAEILAQICDRATAAGKMLVVREWSFVDHAVLGQQTSNLVEKCRNHFDEILRVSLVRDPADQWRSFAEFNRGEGGHDDLAAFMRTYLSFAFMAGVNTTVVKFEDFTSFPRCYYPLICECLKVTAAKNDVNWQSCAHITGDVEGMRQRSKVETIPSKTLTSDVLRELAHNTDYQVACRLLGYAPRAPASILPNEEKP